MPGPSSATVTSAQRAVALHADPSRRSGRGVGADVGEQVVDRLAQTDGIAHHHGRSIEIARQRTVGIGGGKIAGGFAGQPHEVDRLLLQWSSLIGASQQQKIVDQPRHARTFGLDPAHRIANRLCGRECSLAKKLGVAAQGGQRRAQLVGGVGDEATEPRLPRGSLLDAGLDLPQHLVERGSQPAQLCLWIGVRHPSAEVAGGDRRRGLDHTVDRTQPVPDHPPARQRCRGEREESNHHERPHEAVHRLLDRP